MLKSIADDWVLIDVEATAREHKTSAGLLIPHAMENVSFATVVMIGEVRPYPGTDHCGLAPAAAGDRVLIQSIRGIPEHRVTLDGVQYRMIRHHDILGVIAPTAEKMGSFPEQTSGYSQSDPDKDIAIEEGFVEALEPIPQPKEPI